MFAVFAIVCFLHGPVAPRCFPAQLSRPFENETICAAATPGAIAEWRKEAAEVGWEPLDIRTPHCGPWRPPPDEEF